MPRPRQPLRHPLRHLPLRVVLVLPFVLQVTVAVGLTGWLSSRNGEKAVGKVASQLLGSVSDNIQQKLEAYLELPQLINRTNANAIHLGQIYPQNLPSLERHFWYQMQLYPAVSQIQYADAAAQRYLGVSRRRGIASPIEVEVYDARPSHIQSNIDGAAAETRRDLGRGSTPPYNPFADPWYTEAVSARQPIWSSVYQYVGLPVVAMTASYPLYDPAGKLQGVLATDLMLSDISRFLQHQTMSQKRAGFYHRAFRNAGGYLDHRVPSAGGSR
ncbi:cache domain-containing protein [Neosynechococcus sphagnicola]|uniref:PDC sensor domain-containing protein n=1 Tax=Neosynechococcus sphagnicola TaxID=1501145 RepID=UPI0006914BF1|nr:cache domain-containing protein [Neosynechococcus sphagnicola]